MDFRAATTLLQATSITILTGTTGTRTFTIIRTRETHMRIIPRRQVIGTPRIELTTVIIAITLTTASKSK